jgi:hypothetical protein
MWYPLSNGLKKSETWSNREIEITATNSSELNPVQGVLPSDIQTLHYHLGDMHNLNPKIRGDMAFQR